MDSGVVEPSRERAKVEEVEDWMWEWRKWRQVALGEPCPAGLVYSMDLHAGTSCARLPDDLRARLDAVEAARGGVADERPLAPFPPRPDTPPAVMAAGEEAEKEQEAGNKGDEEAYGPSESGLALMYEDDAGPDVYAGMDVDPAIAPLLPMPTAVPPPPLGTCEERHCRFNAAEGAHRHRLTRTGRREAGMLASALERDEFQRPGQVAQEKGLVAESPGGQVRCIHLRDAAVLDHHPGDVRAAEPQEGLPLSVRLSLGLLLDEAGLEDVRRDGGLSVALWLGGADAWRREQAMRPLEPEALGSHALLVAMHPGGAEVVFGTDCVVLAGDDVVLVPTSGSYRLESRGSDPRLLVVVGTRLDSGADPQGSEPHAVTVGGDEAAGRDSDEAGEEQPTEEEQEQDQPEATEEGVDVQAHVAAALTRIMADARPPPTTEALEEEDQRRVGDGAQDAMEQDEELEIVGVKEAHEMERTRLGQRRGRWKPAVTGPRGGAPQSCGKGHLHFTRADGADVRTAVHRQLPDTWPQAFWPPGHEGLVGVEWRAWTANSPCPPVVVLPRRTSHPSWETVAVLWGWVAVRVTGGHIFTASRGTVIERDRGMAMQLTVEPLTTHVVVAVLQWGADKPQHWRDPIARAVWRDLPILRAAVWSGGARRHFPGALRWLRDCGNASPPPAEMCGATEGLYAAGSEPGPRHHFLVAADHAVELSDDVVALAADVAQCLAPNSMMLPREGWEGQQHDQTPAALLIARYIELGGSEAVYLDRLETPSMRHWTAHHLLAPDMRLTVDPLDRRVVSGARPQWPHTWDMAVNRIRMAPRSQRAEWPGAEHLLATAQAAQVQQPAGNDKDCGVCALMSALGTLLRVPRPGNLLSTLDRRWVAAVVLNRDMGPIARLPSLGELPAAVLDALPAPRTPLDVADVPHTGGFPGACMRRALLCMAAAADGGMSLPMRVSLKHVQDAMQQQQLHTP